MRSQERLEKSEKKEDARSGMLRARDCAQGVQGAPGRADGLQGRVLPSRASSLSDNLVKNTPGLWSARPKGSLCESCKSRAAYRKPFAGWLQVMPPPKACSDS